MGHLPVMVKEIVSVFTDVPEGIFIDATIGLGGHALAVNRNLPGKFSFFGFDRDGEMIELARENLPRDFRLRKMTYSKIPSALESESIGPVTGALFDLGLNSLQLENGGRGFSYRERSLLDLRFDRTSGKPLHKMVDKFNLSELVDILKTYGQEKNSRAIARAIIDKRPKTTDELAEIVRKIAGSRNFNKSASRVFQALRIYLNDELDEFEKALKGIVPLISKGGRIAVISYHSLEDGIVKRIFRLYSGKCQCGPGKGICECGARKIIDIKTKKPVRPGEAEVMNNPRARSARLRYAEKI
ncbi:MAG: 16S rRNA (cytosine(1402)-N(4))-methyltransferase RsmH [Candidatus Zixiibacteriota bacterium]|nr:MAG: 16S rRNA (cytosine(1402)-N(4))-methyltransferase RsmH [candidate division Zixibacteria bacterium]